MSGVLASQHFSGSHPWQQNRISPSRSFLPPSNAMSGSRKRKADDDGDNDERMSASPSNSPAISSQTLPQIHPNRHSKRVRTNVSGRPLALPRLLETLSADEMRMVFKNVCERHPDIGAEITATAPRPSVTSTLEVLRRYEEGIWSAFPYGGRVSGDYAYNRVRQPLADMIDALKDYTPQFLPPNESHSSTSLTFLDGATDIIDRLPDWDSYQHNRHKQEAYEEISRAWTLTIQEAAKRAAGIHLQSGGWDQKLSKHNQLSDGRMQEAVDALRECLSGMAGNPQSSIREQLFSGTYGNPVRVGRS